MGNGERFNRHFELFGRAGQARIATKDLTVVGASGLGTPTLLYLAFLGPRRICIIEPSYLKESSRNRNFAVRNSDASDISRKVEIAARMVRSKSSRTTVDIIPERLESAAAFAAIERSDYVFGCVDHDGVRFILNEVSLAYDKPLIDMASDVQANSEEFGGRVTFVQPGEACLYCLGLLDDTDVRRYLSSAAELRNEAAAYGVPVDHLSSGTGPSVATINGVIAGLGVTEFWAAVTGMRQPYRTIAYLGCEATIRKSVDESMGDCYYCNIVRGRGTASGVHRHISRVNSAA